MERRQSFFRAIVSRISEIDIRSVLFFAPRLKKQKLIRIAWKLPVVFHAPAKTNATRSSTSDPDCKAEFVLC